MRELLREQNEKISGANGLKTITVGRINKLGGVRALEDETPVSIVTPTAPHTHLAARNEQRQRYQVGTGGNALLGLINT